MSDDVAAPSNAPELSVTQLASAIKRTVEDAFGYVRLRGEISGYRGPSPSGHVYFRLKDEGAVIEAVIWKGVFGRLRFKPQEGLEVIAIGRVTTFPGSSKYQIVVESLEPAGVGALMALLDERRKKLTAEGLFDPERKRPLPYLPEVIGVVTSPTGAVIRDILHRLADRFPRRVLVWPVRVQGEESAKEVAAAINGFNAIGIDDDLPRPDVIIVARGGGSLEDLWGFNEEIVVRAAAASEIPLISAVGHETDTTLIDFAADRRAPTPTAAAEMAVPVRAELIGTTDDFARRLRAAERRLLDGRATELRSAARALPDAERLLDTARQRLDSVGERLPKALGASVLAKRARFTKAAGRSSPAVLALRVRGESQKMTALGLRLGGALSQSTRLRRIDLDARTQRLSRSLGVYAKAQAIRLATNSDRVTQLAERAARSLGVAATRRSDRLARAGSLLAALSYRGVLARGFALVRDAAGAPLRSAGATAPGQSVTIEFADGRVDATVNSDDASKPAPSSAPASSTPARPTKKPGGEGQGTLF
ncbi:MAG: exodeoxyribonuclease VII large subunit [Alphaproteobacteria bacterium]